MNYPNLLAELARQGITKARLAELLGISRVSLYNKLNGKINFSLKDITKIQEVLTEENKDLTLDYLFKV